MMSPVGIDGSRILIVDDVAENREVLTQTLEPEGYRISAAPDGEVALKIVTKVQPDLILLDLLMPGINGFEVCRQLKKDEATAEIPVIFITANSETESVLKGFEMGAVDFISKPFKAKEVLRRAETHLRLYKLSRALCEQNRELVALNEQYRAEINRRQQAEQNLATVVEGDRDEFYTSGTLRHDAACYVEREADRALIAGLRRGELCYILTSRQMGKSSLMARTSHRLAAEGVRVATVDLTALGQNLTVEQWYDGLLSRIGRRLGLEDVLDDFWLEHERLNPVQRFFAALREVVLAKRSEPIVIFVDELDVVRSLPFSTDEFFGAIRECYNRRSEDSAFRRLTFCLLGVGTPTDLIEDSSLTPFNLGHRIPLEDFKPADVAPLQNGIENAGYDVDWARACLERVLYWTNGHPYLTQRICRGLVDEGGAARESASEAVDAICQRIFLSTRAIERDDNLIFVRERFLRNRNYLSGFLDLYESIAREEFVADDEDNGVINQLQLTGLIRCDGGALKPRNRIYQSVFDAKWVRAKRVNLEVDSAVA
jgi:CheY-like chemotaxis protein